MFDNLRVIQSYEATVKKLVLTRADAVAETVLYRYPTYEDRTVICCSSQSGCPVGCRFCGAGDYFVRSFTAEEIVNGIASIGEEWHKVTGRKPFFNYCAADDNTADSDAVALRRLFSPQIWECTISVICERNEGLPSRNAHQEALARDFSCKMLDLGYNVRVFDPAGQDDIGGGCGQLWFVQDWMRRNPSLARPSIGFGKKKVGVPA